MPTPMRLAALLAFAALAACTPKTEEVHFMAPQDKKDDGKKVETITLGGGCFWCIEAVYQEVKGVVAVESGYSNGTAEHPSYEEVCTGKTGCAEVCQIKYDPSVIDFKGILKVFFKVHDPTSLNFQGNDHGTQYRSGIYTHTPEQKEIAEKIKKELDASGAWKDPIVTEILAVSKYSKAEDYHQNYFRTHPNQGYCKFVIGPKMDKFRKVFADQLQK
jgi:peptide-methionine (S)-S-oxide reductase